MHFTYLFHSLKKEEEKTACVTAIMRLHENTALDTRTNERICDVSVYNKIYASLFVNK